MSGTEGRFNTPLWVSAAEVGVAGRNHRPEVMRTMSPGLDGRRTTSVING